jgi:hypothetical protein
VLRNISGSVQVPVSAWNNEWKGTLGLPPPVKLEQLHMTYTVLVDLKPDQTNKISYSDFEFRTYGQKVCIYNVFSM